MKKIIAIILAFSAMCSFAGCKGKNPLDGVDIPEFSKAEKGLRFTAYAGPPPANWSGT
jgi:predicted small lipoprotein YifL